MARNGKFLAGVAVGVVVTASAGMLAMQPQVQGSRRGQEDQPDRATGMRQGGGVRGQVQLTQSADGRTAYLWEIDRASGEVHFLGSAEAKAGARASEPKPSENPDRGQGRGQQGSDRP